MSSGALSPGAWTPSARLAFPAARTTRVQVVEGLHGIPFDKPLTRLRETVEAQQMAFRGETRPLSR
jgi:hypothetical protein